MRNGLIKTIEEKFVKINSPIYKEHNDSYYMECINNLADKGIEI